MKILKFSLIAMLFIGFANAAETKRVFKDADHAYKSICGHCHKAGGVGPDTVRMEYPAEVRAERINTIISVVRHGFNAMPPFRKTEIDDVTLKELATKLAEGKIQ